MTAEPILDANGDPVDVPPHLADDQTLRAFMSGRVPAPCGHYIAASEARAGFVACERCPPARARSPYVGHGADGCRRSADIDRSEADTYPTGSPDWQRCRDSADRWDAQAATAAVGEDSRLITASGEVECTECGHVIEQHVGDGCPLCNCPVRWTAAEVADYRQRLGLPWRRP